MEFEEHEVRLRTGTCPSCAKEFAFVEGTTVSTRLGSAPSGPDAVAPGEEPPSEATAGGPECEECGSPQSVRDGRNGALEVTCPECETTTVFVRQGTGDRRERGPERGRRFATEAPRGRPCRQCGAPLRFSTGDDGMLVGECESCGNRFTLPPRPGGGGGSRGFRPGPRYGRRDFRPGRGGGSRDTARGRERRPFRKGPPRDRGRYEDRDERPRRRRRPGDSEE